MKNLTPFEITNLPFGKKCRFGIVDRVSKTLTHPSDSEPWIKAELQRLSNVRYQFVTNI